MKPFPTPRRPVPGVSRLVINLGAAHVAGALVHRTAGRVTLARYGREELDPDPAGDGDWALRAGRALARLARARHWRGEATVVLPGHLTLVKRVRTPSVGECGRDSAVLFAAQQNLPEALDGLTWDGVVLSDDGADLELLLGTARTPLVEAAVDAVTRAELKVAHVRPPGLPPPGPWLAPGQSGVFVNIGARSTLLHFRWPGGWWVRRVGPAGNAVTRLVARGLDSDFATAQRLKHDPAADRSDPGLAAVRRTAGREFAELLALEIRRTSLAFGCGAGSDCPPELWLAGGGSRLPGLTGDLAEFLGRRVTLANPLGGVTGEIPVPEYPVLVDLLSVASVAEGPANWPDLLPWRMKLAISAAKRRRTSLVAAAMLAFAPLALAWAYDRQAGRLAAEEHRIAGELGPRRLAWEQQRSLTARLGRDRTAWEAAVRLKSQAESWPGFLAGLDAAVVAVDGVWLERLVPVTRTMAPKAAAPGTPRQIALGGRLQVPDPETFPADEAAARMRRLVQAFARLPEVAAVTAERFDRRAGGELRFECVLNLKPESYL
jgi:Tfp pilus assembly PilM family ATPase